ncbi:MAG TPA: hypothetical protein VGH28_08890 [Polyangiaceae bacterium]
MNVAWAELRAKYEEMLALRRLGDAPHDPRPRLAALAERFPGALREIDALPEDEIASRIDALALAERDPTAATPWMHAMTRFHTLARAALFAKRALHERPAGSKGARSPLVEGAALDQDIFHGDPRIAAPPRGRLMDLVYEKLAAELGTTPADAKRLVFGPPRR